MAFTLCLLANICYGQEILTGFQRGTAKALSTKAAQDHVTTLPFFDDFSTANIYPDSTKWCDRFAFVNDGFPMFPPNRKAATLDVLDETGAVYSNAISNPFVAESLTSVRIRLDSVFVPEAKALTPADSLYLSFRYQPQGYGNAPESHDSLVLEFGITAQHEEFFGLGYNDYSVDEILAHVSNDTLFPGDTIFAFGDGCYTSFFTVIPDTLVSGDDNVISIPCDSIFYTVTDTTWHHIWSAAGQSLESFMADNGGDYFKQVMIPITNLNYFSPDFCFRFYNYASIVSSANPTERGNEDIWNIDLVYLNRGRTMHDTNYPKVTFSGQTPSFLSRYRSMPYRQYRTNPTSAISERLQLYIANLDNAQHNVHYYYKVEQVNGNQEFGYDGGSTVLDPYNESGFLACSGDDAALACPYVAKLFALDYDRDTTSFLIRHYISDSTSNPPLVDSMVYHQGFYNYYAYDDGVPELGYGVEPAYGSFAVKFEVSAYDTIRGVQLLFNHTLNDANNQPFNIIVWKDNNGRPGDELYSLDNQIPEWDGQPYRFSYYEFPDRVYVNGVFYIGIEQQSAGSINIGFDGSNDNHQYNFFNVSGSWQNSQFAGSLAIRPVVGPDSFYAAEEHHDDAIRLYPNPSNGILHIDGVEQQTQATTTIFDLMGRMLYRASFQPEISVSELDNGLYFISITTEDGKVISKKFMISK